MNGPVLASRTRKARRSGTCALCHGLVLVGQLIGLIPAGWAHTDCINQANQAGRQVLVIVAERDTAEPVGHVSQVAAGAKLA